MLRFLKEKKRTEEFTSVQERQLRDRLVSTSSTTRCDAAMLSL